MDNVPTTDAVTATTTAEVRALQDRLARAEEPAARVALAVAPLIADLFSRRSPAAQAIFDHFPKTLAGERMAEEVIAATPTKDRYDAAFRAITGAADAGELDDGPDALAAAQDVDALAAYVDKRMPVLGEHLRGLAVAVSVLRAEVDAIYAAICGQFPATIEGERAAEQWCADHGAAFATWDRIIGALADLATGHSTIVVDQLAAS